LHVPKRMTKITHGLPFLFLCFVYLACQVQGSPIQFGDKIALITRANLRVTPILDDRLMLGYVNGYATNFTLKAIGGTDDGLVMYGKPISLQDTDRGHYVMVRGEEDVVVSCLYPYQPARECAWVIQPADDIHNKDAVEYGDAVYIENSLRGTYFSSNLMKYTLIDASISPFIFIVKEGNAL